MKSVQSWWRSWLLVLIVAMTPLFGCGAPAKAQVDPQKQLTEFTKPAVVRVVSYNTIVYTITPELANYLGVDQQNQYYDGGTGSGAILSDNGYIVTNAHVVEATKLDDKTAQDNLDKMFLADLYKLLKQKDASNADNVYQYAIKTTQAGQIQRVSQVILPGGDSYPFDIKAYGAPIGEGKDVSVIKIDASNLPIILIDDSDSVQTSDKVTIAGYPGKADLKGYLDDKSQLVSTYTNGAVAAKKTSEKGPILQLDANVNPGNSGGPVLSEAGKIVGMATATSNDGIGWAIPSTTIMEFARQAGAPVNQPGTVTKEWQDGLTLYWENYYSKAMPKFEDVQRLYPKFYSITDYISKTQQAIDAGKDRKDWQDYMGYYIGGGVVLIVLIGGVVTFLVLRSRKKPNSSNGE